MAHGITNDIAGERFDVFSAGISPSNVHPAAIEVMREIDIDITCYSSNHINEYVEEDFNFVITVCDNANNNCPVFPGGPIKLHWGINEPFRNWSFDKKDLEIFRNTRNIIKEKIKEFLINI